ncbi:L,D-transpeptidase [Streptomyces catenulae]|uniref:L,D-transpeptidase n=1 Tax=Streptomyces catenulae TaxID=66875 RepID=A0ABV2Z0W2_9ACTN|nr:L,D-transpeptidase [Streptomyces catenulae]
MPARSSTIVTALTAAALVAVGFLGYQASASAPADLHPHHKSGDSAGKHPAQQPGGAKKEHRPAAPKVPEASGAGKRIVYALGAKRVWLVGEDETATRTFAVAPSTVSPPMGTYAVASRSVSVTGSDGIAIEHVVRFASVDGVVIGFSAAVDGSSPNPDASQRTGGIRESRADGAAMWDFAVNGTKVVVVA